MRKPLLVAAWFLTLPVLRLQGQGNAAAPKAPDRQPDAESLAFQEQKGADLPVGWSGGPPGTVLLDHKEIHSATPSVRLQRDKNSVNSFSVLTRGHPVDFVGKQIQLRGFLRTQDVSDFAGLWLREDGDGAMLSIDNMQAQHLHGTTGWAQYSVTLPLDPKATDLIFGALMSGTGTAWVDDLELLVDGKPIAQTPRLPQAPKKLTPLDLDHEFDSGSRIFLDHPSPIQIENLATLGQVWGFLKYHYPAITSGQHHWDYDLFRVMPSILAAGTRPAANAALVRWIDSLGPIPPCNPCAELKEIDLQLKPDLAWIHDKARLGEALSRRLERIYANRPASQQFYVSLHAGVHNPSFDHELAYSSVTLPDAGFQLLSLYRFWNILQYWAPNREVAGQDWPQVLREFIPKVALANDKDAYTLAMMAFTAKVNDTHANLWGSLQLRPPVGDCRLPVNVRFVEGKPIVTDYDPPATGAAPILQPSGLKIADPIESIDGKSIAALRQAWAPYYADSNEAARLRDLASFLTRGTCGPTTVKVRRNGALLPLRPARLAEKSLRTPTYTHDLPGDTFRLLSPDVAYLKLSSIKIADVPHDIEQARGTKGLIVDIRNYPSQYVVFALGSLLVTKHTPFVTFTAADLSNPGAFYWSHNEALDPAQPHYDGKVVVLVDELSQSQAEYTTIALRSAPNAIVVGSTTAGADGNVSAIPLPGNLNSMISGLGVFYPNKTPTQRVGIHPDIWAVPTGAGIAAGRDEVLETAIKQILPTVPALEIRRMARPSAP